MSNDRTSDSEESSRFHSALPPHVPQVVWDVQMNRAARNTTFVGCVGALAVPAAGAIVGIMFAWWLGIVAAIGAYLVFYKGGSWLVKELDTAGRRNLASEFSAMTPDQRAAAARRATAHLPAAGRRAAEAAELAVLPRDNGDELVHAFADLTALPTDMQAWLSRNSGAVERAGRELAFDEQIGHVAVGRQGNRPVALVVTNKRLGLVGSRGAQWYPRRTLYAVRPIQYHASSAVEILYRTDQLHETYRVEVQVRSIKPLGAAQAIVSFFDNAVRRDESPGTYGAVTASGKARYLGGTFVGNQARRRSALSQRLPDNARVYISLTDDDNIGIQYQTSMVARYSLHDSCVRIDTATAIGRSLRKNWMIGSAAATLLFGPIGLIGLAKSSQRKQEAFALEIDDDEDYAVFALDDSTFGRRILARTRSTGS